MSFHPNLRFVKAIAIALICTSFLFLNCSSPKKTPQKTDLGNDNLTPRRAEVLFLGHNSTHHDSRKYAPWLAIKLFPSGINTSYTTELSDLNPENLRKYDGLIIYSNHDSLPPAQEAALKQFVAEGKGLIPLHCASGCFLNSEWYIKTIGGQFASHGLGRFKNTIVDGANAVMKSIPEFETFDETYVHKNLNPNKTLLGVRVDSGRQEPYTWVREEGKARIFYTAYGHDDSTWTNQGFLDLVRNGVLWALGDKVLAQIDSLHIPNVDIYDADTISHYSQRHLVPKMQQELTAAESQKIIQVPPDFKIELFAAEPDIVNPIAMSWDTRGRLWIVESVDYPNTFKETDGGENDQIKICEDTNGDGKADRFTVFADKLNIPTGIVFANDGVIVSMAPDFLFLKDTDGDDKADVHEKISTGWGKFDTHAGPSNLQYGFDNKIWGAVGYSGFDGTMNDEKIRFSQGVYRFDPDGKNFEYLAGTSNNTWGLGFSEDNNVFISTANNTHAAFYSQPEKNLLRLFPAVDSTPNVLAIQKIDGHYEVETLTPNLRQVDVLGGFTSAAGSHLYTARNFPKEYWNRISFVAEPTVRLVHNAIIEPDGAGFKEKDGWNMLASNDEWFAPVHAEVGPDGAVWVADWNNFILQHNVFVPQQAPSELVLPFKDQPQGQGNAFSSSLRDVNHGRVYRVVYKKSPAVSIPNLSKNNPEGLVAALSHSNMFWRLTAQRLLVEAKNLSVLPGLYALIANEQADELGLNPAAIHALWTLHGLGAIDSTNKEALEVVKKALAHPAASVRKAAVMVLPKTVPNFSVIQPLIKDPNLNTRLAALVALMEYPPDNTIGSAIFESAQNPENEKDPWLRAALFAAAARHEAGFLDAAQGNDESALSKAIEQSVLKEVYPIDRRSRMIFPIDVSGKEITLRTTINKPSEGELDGFIVGQGDKENGYGIFIENGQLVFLVNQNGNSSRITSTEPLPFRFEVMAALTDSGKMSLAIDGKTVNETTASGLFTKPLSVTLRSGAEIAEAANRLGNFSDDFGFKGNFQNATLELVKPENLARINPGGQGGDASANATVIDLGTLVDLMQYDKKEFTVEAGKKIIINFTNPDVMQHNLLILARGALEKIGQAADDMLRDPKASEKSYVPSLPEVLHSTRLLNSGESTTLEFTAPDEPGDYPYVCTFPGHWRGMNGIMKVVE